MVIRPVPTFLALVCSFIVYGIYIFNVNYNEYRASLTEDERRQEDEENEYDGW